MNLRQLLRGSLTTVAFCGMSLSLAHAAEFVPEKLQGLWHGSNGKKYDIAVQNGQVRVTVNNPKNPKSKPKLYQGSFHPQTVGLSYQPLTVNDLAPNLPDDIRQKLFARPYLYKAELTLTPQGQVTFIDLYDDITYNPKTRVVKTVTLETGSEAIALSRQPGYTIGGIQVDDRLFQRRNEALAVDLDRQIKFLKDTSLPVAEAEYDRLKKQQQEDLERIEGYQAQKRARQDDATVARNKLIALENSPTAQKKKAVEQTIKRLEDSIISGTAKPRLDEALKRLKDEQEALRQLTVQWAEEQKKTAGYAEQQQALKTAEDEIIRLNDLIESLFMQYVPVSYRLVAQADQFYKIIYDIRQKEREKEYLLENKPHVIKIEMTASGQKRFDADVQRDDAVLSHFDEEFDAYRRGWSQAQQNIQVLKDELTLAESEKTRFKDDFKKAATSFTAVSQELNTMLRSNAKKRFLVDVGADGGEVLKAGLEGGVESAFIEACMKVVEASIVNEQQKADDHFSMSVPFLGEWRAPFGFSYQLFDESDLREKYYQKAYAEELDSVDSELSGEEASFLVEKLKEYRNEQVKKAPVTILNELLQVLPEQKHLEKEAQALMRKLSGDPGFVTQACQTLAKLETVNKTISQSKIAGESVSQHLIENRRALMKQLIHLKNEEEAFIKSLPKARKALGELQAKLLKLEVKSLSEFAKHLGVNIGISMAVDGVQNFFHSVYEADEAAMWEEYFQKEVEVIKTQKPYRAAITQYWKTRDAIAAQEAYQQGMLALMLDNRKQKEAYLQSCEKCGFYIAQNDEFFAQNDPLNLTLTVATPPSRTDARENVFLGPQKGNLSPLMGQQASTAPAPDLSKPLPSGTPVPTNKTGGPMKIRHLFVFPAYRLTDIQETGPLPLQIQQL